MAAHSPASSPMNDRQKALAVLPLLSAWRMDQYEPWIQVGMALHATDKELYDAWVEWSRQSAKFELKACERHWRSFKQGKGIGLGSLIQWANEDSGLDAVRGALRLMPPRLPRPTTNPAKSTLIGPPTSSKLVGGIPPTPQLQSHTRTGLSLPDELLQWLRCDNLLGDFDSLILGESRRIGGVPSSLYVYHDQDGQVAFCVIRFDTGPDKKTFRPISLIDGRLQMSDPGGLLPLFRLHLLGQNSQLFLVEGEKTAVALLSIGIMATTTAHGASAPGKSDLLPLADRDVVIWSDNDEAGRAWEDKLVDLLGKLARRPRVRLLQVSGLPPKGDAYDFIEQKRRDGLADLQIKEEIEALLLGGEVVEFPDRIVETQPFPTEAYPEPVASFIRCAAKAIGCSPAFVGCPLLAAFASLIGNTRQVELKRGWTEPSIIWTVIVGDSGTLKSPAFRLVMKPLHEMQFKAMKEHAEAVRDFKAEMIRYEHACHKWKKSGAGDPPHEPAPPPEPRLIVSDTTFEALAPILQNNWRGLLLACDELASWVNSFDRYAKGQGADEGRWLSVHAGDALIVDRKTGPIKTIVVPRASISIAGGIQPETLARVLGRQHRETGLAARLLMVMPSEPIKRWRDDDIPPELEAQIADIMDKLRELQPQQTIEGPEPITLRLTPEAKTLWVEFYNSNASEQAKLARDLSAVWSKLEGYAARLALVIHCLRQACEDRSVDRLDFVDEISMAAGIKLSRWFGAEARRIYGLVLDGDESTKELRELIRIIEHRSGIVSVREWQRIRSHPTALLAEQELQQLVDAGFGVWYQPPQTAKGRPQSKRFRLYSHADADNKPANGPET